MSNVFASRQDQAPANLQHAGSSIPPQAPQESNVQYAVFVFFFFLGGGDLGLKGSHLFGDENPIRQWFSKGMKDTCEKVQGSSLENGVDIRTFVR